jgi:GNAT superfamily N-acetyltransferase
LITTFADIELAMRLEEAEAYAAEAFARELARRRPRVEIEVEEVAGGKAVFAGAGSPLSESKAVGMRGPVSDTDLDRMEAVFFSRGEPSRVVVCPLADPSLVEGLGRRGYRLFGFENILVLPLSQEENQLHAASDIEVRPVGSEEADLYAQVVAPNFLAPGQSTDEVLEMMVTMIGMEHAWPFLAFIHGEPVGGGAVLIHQRLALLAGAATLPAYRNRGVHAALHHARLALARRNGCDLAAQGAQAGSTSQRNAERWGFRVAYTRAMLIREPS